MTVGDGADRAGAVDPDVGQHDDGHVADGLAGARPWRGPRGGTCRACRSAWPSGVAHTIWSAHAADGVLGVGDVAMCWAIDVAVAQRRELAARSVDHGGVTGELQPGDRAARAHVLDEHLDPEVHGDVTAAGVLAATEQ